MRGVREAKVQIGQVPNDYDEVWHGSVGQQVGEAEIVKCGISKSNNKHMCKLSKSKCVLSKMSTRSGFVGVIRGQNVDDVDKQFLTLFGVISGIVFMDPKTSNI